MKLIKKHGVIVLVFALGWAARGILAGTDAPLWLSIFVSTALLLVAFGIMAATNEKRPAPRVSFDTELRGYLKKHNFVLTTREMAAAAWPIIESPHASRGKAIFVHPDTLAKLKAHRENCEKRWNVLGVCTCPIFHNAAQEPKGEGS